MGRRLPSLARRVRLLTGGVGIVFLLVIAGLATSVGEFRDDINRREALTPASTDVSELSGIFLTLLDHPDEVDAPATQLALVLLGRLEREVASQPALLDDLALIRSDLLSWNASVRLSSAAGRDPTNAQVLSASADTQRRLLHNVVNRTGDLATGIGRANDDAAAAVGASRTRLMWSIVIAGGLALVLLLTGISLLRRWFIAPMLKLVDDVGSVAEGDHTHELRADGSLEFVELADSVSRMRDRILAERDRVVRATEAVDQQAPAVAALRTLLEPRHPGDVTGVAVAGGLLPAEGELAGDWYDLHRRDGSVIVALGDVCGHGIDAGVLAVRTKFALLDAMVLGLDPAAALALAALRFARDDTFVTAMVVEIDPAAGRCRYASAGHNPGVIVRTDGSVAELPRTGPLIGLIDGPRPNAEVAIGPGDTVVLYTDGVVEARDADGHQFGIESVLAVIREHADASPERLVEAMNGAVLAHCGGRCTDDATIIVVRVDQV